MLDLDYHVDPPGVAYAGSELAIQTILLSRAAIVCPAVTLAAVPNAAKRGPRAQRQVRREGLRRGFEDLIATWPGRGVAFLEMKDRDGRVSVDQHEWLERHTRQGFPVGVFRHPDTALEFLRRHGAPFIDRPSPFEPARIRSAALGAFQHLLGCTPASADRKSLILSGYECGAITGDDARLLIEVYQLETA